LAAVGEGGAVNYQGTTFMEKRGKVEVRKRKKKEE